MTFETHEIDSLFLHFYVFTQTRQQCIHEDMKIQAPKVKNDSCV